MRRESEADALERGLELLVVEVRKLERLRHDDRVFLDAIRPMDQIGRVELEQAAAQYREVVLVLWQRHDLHTHQHYRRCVIHDDREIELAARFDDPQSGLHLAVARAFSADAIEEAFDVFLGDHRLTWFEVREVSYAQRSSNSFDERSARSVKCNAINAARYCADER